MIDPNLAAVLALLRSRDPIERRGPLIMAIDGRSGTGKSTLARRVALETGAAVIEGDDFYRGGLSVGTDSARSRARRCLDRNARREVLEALRDGREARWTAFDWEAFDGRMCPDERSIPPGVALVVLEGVYSACPDLADLTDIAVLLRAPPVCREARLLARDGPEQAWDRQWREAEDWYFTAGLTGRRFDLVLG